MRTVIEYVDVPCLIDADGLNLLSDNKDLLDRLAGASGSQLLRSLCVQPRYGAAQTQTFGSYDAAVTRSEGLAEDAGVEAVDGLIRHGQQAVVALVVARHGDLVAELLGSGLVRDEPRVRQNADGAARGVDAVVDAPRCVVRRLKRRDARRADGERREPLHLAEHWPDLRDAPGELARGGGGGVDGNPVALDERLQAGDVVAVPMGDEDGIDLRESDAELLERGLDAPGGDARVHEDARALRIDDQAVPLGAAGQSMYCNHVAVPSKNARHKDKTSARRKRQTLEFLLNASADLCLVLGRFDGHIHHLNVRADRAELADKILIASLDKLNLADLGCPPCGQTRDHERRACAQVARVHRRALEMLDALDHGHAPLR